MLSRFEAHFHFGADYDAVAPLDRRLTTIPRPIDKLAQLFAGSSRSIFPSVPITTLQLVVAALASQSGAVGTGGASIRKARCFAAGTDTSGTSFSFVVSFFAAAETAPPSVDPTRYIRFTRKTGLAGNRFTLVRKT